MGGTRTGGPLVIFVIMGLLVLSAAAVAAFGLAREAAGPPDASSPPGGTAGSEPDPGETATAAPSFPDETTTGVPEGVELRPSGDIVVTWPGTVVEGLDVQGSIDIQADNVTIRNTRVSTGEHQYPIRVRPGVVGTLIERVEVSNEDHHGKGIYFERSSGTVRGANIHSAEDGVFITGDDVLVEDSYIHHLVATETSHNDTIQIRHGSDITIRNNNLQVYNDRTGDPMNAAVQIGSLVGDEPIRNLSVTGNLMNGGNFTVNGGREGELASAVFSGNRFGEDFRFGIAGNLGAGITWEETNVFDATGEPAS